MSMRLLLSPQATCSTHHLVCEQTTNSLTFVTSAEPLELDYRPVVRDNFFYGVSVILLCVLLAVDDQVHPLP